MTKVTGFEDSHGWQKARQLANTVDNLSAFGSFSKDHELRSQIRRAARSAVHNIAEGSDAGSDVELCRFPRMSRRFASEVQSQLYLALDRNYITDIQLRETCHLATDVKNLTNRLILYLTGDR